jgi:hypothetical protein
MSEKKGGRPCAVACPAKSIFVSIFSYLIRTVPSQSELLQAR